MAWLRRLVPARWRPLTYLEDKTRRETRCEVVGGPFRGMKYVERSFGSAYIPKLLGIYEHELARHVEKAIAQDFDQIVVLGASEGYYAVGMAYRCPESAVIAYESDPEARAALARMARLNGLGDRVTIFGTCDRGTLAAEILEAPDGKEETKRLLICDCEGGELILLDPLRLAALRNTWILVEVHDFCVRGTGDELRDRFLPTHHIERIWQDARDRRDEYPYADLYTRLLPSSYLHWAMSEWRPEPMYWYWMEPRASRCER
jgi:hypothetical protein